MPAGLSHILVEEGNFLGIGQKRLLCVARVVLKKAKILVLDEPSAGTDTETEILIKKVIEKEFQNSTILTITHRLKTMMDMDKYVVNCVFIPQIDFIIVMKYAVPFRIIILEKGRILEFDTAVKLSQNRNSLFYQMLQYNNV